MDKACTPTPLGSPGKSESDIPQAKSENSDFPQAKAESNIETELMLAKLW